MLENVANNFCQGMNQVMLMNPLVNPLGWGQHLVKPNSEPNALDNPLLRYVIDAQAKEADSKEQMIGNYKVVKMGPDKYAVSVYHAG